jgi:hypothetical protein
MAHEIRATNPYANNAIHAKVMITPKKTTASVHQLSRLNLLSTTTGLCWRPPQHFVAWINALVQPAVPVPAEAQPVSPERKSPLPAFQVEAAAPNRRLESAKWCASARSPDSATLH